MILASAGRPSAERRAKISTTEKMYCDTGGDTLRPANLRVWYLPPALAAALADALVDGGSRRFDHGAEEVNDSVLQGRTDEGRDAATMKTRAPAKNPIFIPCAPRPGRARKLERRGWGRRTRCALVGRVGCRQPALCPDNDENRRSMLLEAGTPHRMPDSRFAPASAAAAARSANRFLTLTVARNCGMATSTWFASEGGQPDGGTEGSTKRLRDFSSRVDV